MSPLNDLSSLPPQKNVLTYLAVLVFLSFKMKK